MENQVSDADKFIKVATIVQDKLAMIRATSSQCLSVFKQYPNLADLYPFEATKALEEEVNGAAERVDAAMYILEDLIAMQKNVIGAPSAQS